MFRRLCALFVLASCLVAAPVVAAPVPHPAPSAAPDIGGLIRDLGSSSQKVREAASQRLQQMPRDKVLEVAAQLAGGTLKLQPLPTQLYSIPAVALGVLNDMGDARAGRIALQQGASTDADMRDSACAVIAKMPKDEDAAKFLVAAFQTWGQSNVSGVRSLFRALDQPDIMTRPDMHAAIVAFLNTPLPAVDPRFKYGDAHEPPHDGDQHRCWLYKADATLYLIARYPWPGARPGVVRCLGLDELRVGAAVALPAVGGGTDYSDLLRELIKRDTSTEHRLALYRALVLLKLDSSDDRMAARDLFTSTAAPSPAWIQGLSAMVALFAVHEDEPALRVVSIWKLTGEAADIRASAMAAMREAHPELYDKILSH
jgi:hypothetical protein